MHTSLGERFEYASLTRGWQSAVSWAREHDVPGTLVPTLLGLLAVAVVSSAFTLLIAGPGTFRGLLSQGQVTDPAVAATAHDVGQPALVPPPRALTDALATPAPVQVADASDRRSAVTPARGQTPAAPSVPISVADALDRAPGANASANTAQPDAPAMASDTPRPDPADASPGQDDQTADASASTDAPADATPSGDDDGVQDAGPADVGAGSSDPGA
jgi:hypothetical protein